MRVLIDLNHPAHVHLMRHAVAAWRVRGDQCLITARDKDVCVSLLRSYGMEHEVLAPVGRGRLGLVRELVSRELRLLLRARRFRPHAIVGTTIHAGRVGRLVGARSVFLNEDDVRVSPLIRWLGYPLVNAVATPTCLAYEGWGRRHRTYAGYHELFYLHPNRFAPDPEIRRDLGLAPADPYAVVRLSALRAHHDVGIRGLSRSLLDRVLEQVGDRVRVFVTGEAEIPAELRPLSLRLPPERLHDALAFAEFVLGDSQTMTAEAAVLGVPAFRVSDFVGRLSYLDELESYGLAFGFRPEATDELLSCLQRTLEMVDRKRVFESRRKKLLEEKIDPLPWLLDLVDELVSGSRAVGPVYSASRTSLAAQSDSATSPPSGKAGASNVPSGPTASSNTPPQVPSRGSNHEKV
jgi:predicted glycosyltransferase